MLGWFADAADPDAGLLAFRTHQRALGTTHWYLKMLRDEGSAAERLAHVLAPQPLRRRPADPRAGVRWRSSATTGAWARARARRWRATMTAATPAQGVRRRRDDGGAGGPPPGAVPRRRRRPARCARTSPRSAAPSPTSPAATLQAALDVAVARGRGRPRARCRPGSLVVGMGRLGGAELGYASDADVMFVHEPDRRGRRARRRSRARTRSSRSCAGCSAAAGPDPPLDLDADLRPEGKNGPLVRTLAVLPRLLRALVAGLGGPGAAAGHADRRRRRPGPAVPRR